MMFALPLVYKRSRLFLLSIMESLLSLVNLLYCIAHSLSPLLSPMPLLSASFSHHGRSMSSLTQACHPRARKRSTLNSTGHYSNLFSSNNSRFAAGPKPPATRPPAFSQTIHHFCRLLENPLHSRKRSKFDRLHPKGGGTLAIAPQIYPQRYESLRNLSTTTRCSDPLRADTAKRGGVTHVWWRRG